MSKADDREFISIMKKVGVGIAAVVVYFIKKNRDKKKKDK